MSAVMDLAYTDFAEHVLSAYAHEERWLWLRDQLAARLQDAVDEFLDEIGDPSTHESAPRRSAVHEDSGQPLWGPL